MDYDSDYADTKRIVPDVDPYAGRVSPFVVWNSIFEKTKTMAQVSFSPKTVEKRSSRWKKIQSSSSVPN